MPKMECPRGRLLIRGAGPHLTFWMTSQNFGVMTGIYEFDDAGVTTAPRHRRPSVLVTLGTSESRDAGLC